MHAPCATNAIGNTPVASLVTRTGAPSPVYRAAGPWLEISTRHASLDTPSWVRESRTIRQRQCRRFRPCTFAAAHMSRGKAAPSGRSCAGGSPHPVPCMHTAPQNRGCCSSCATPALAGSDRRPAGRLVSHPHGCIKAPRAAAIAASLDTCRGCIKTLRAAASAASSVTCRGC